MGLGSAALRAAGELRYKTGKTRQEKFENLHMPSDVKTWPMILLFMEIPEKKIVQNGRRSISKNYYSF